MFVVVLIDRQSEWDELMLETVTLRAQLDAARQELSHALYQQDAACRVIARLVRERDEAQKLVASLQAVGFERPRAIDAASAAAMVSATQPQGTSAGSNGAGQLEPTVNAAAALPATVLSAINERCGVLSAARRGRKASATLSALEAVRTYSVTATHTPHKADGKTGVCCIATSATAPDSTLLLTGATDKTAALCDATTGRVLARLSDHSKKVSSVAFHGGSAALFTGSADKCVKVRS
jgi:pre-mRNA-processing factor 19